MGYNTPHKKISSDNKKQLSYTLHPVRFPAILDKLTTLS